MLTEFKISLICEKDFYNINMGSVFHGLIMDLVGSEYAEELHNDALKPFSQSISMEESGILWRVCGLNRKFAEVFKAAVMDTAEVHIKDKNRTLKIDDCKIKAVLYRDFIKDTYFGESEDYINVYFNSPASYKQDGKYINYPALSNIYPNLIRKFDAFSNEFSIYDEQMLDSIIPNTFIASYNLRSTNYHLESIKIPSFTGRIGIKIKGTPQMKNLIYMLLKFGEYSGVGIKTAMGMGAVKVLTKKRGNENDE